MFSRPNLYGNITKICATASARSSNNPTTTAAVANNTQIREYHEVTGDILCPSQVMGIDHIRDPRLNKGLAFTLEERQVLGIHGLQPARFKTQEEQLQLCKIAVNRYTESLNKYLYLSDLQDRNERLFFRFLSENIEELMPIVYTPTVGLACQRFGLIYRRPRGLFVTINDRGHIFDVIKNWPEPDVRAIVVTDGERILGLGDLGASGMGIPVGKLALYTALAGIKPHQCLPILIDVGTNNIDLLEDPLYVGLRQKRVIGREYDDFIDEFMQAVVKRYGQNTLIQFEDFGNHNAFRFLDKYRNTYCTFNDDIQGTAAVAVAGLYASKRITGKSFVDYTFLFAGAGEAAIGIADLVVRAMVAEGVPIDVARSKIWMVDINGLLTSTRQVGNLEGHKLNYAKDVEPMTNLEDIVDKIKPNVLIGASAAPGIFTPKILQTMAANNERPVVFALSNPTSKAECTAEQAYQNTDGRVIFSSGSPFPPVTINGKTFSPGQGNNAYIFPGVALGVIATGTHHIPDDMFLIAAQELANFVDEADLDRGSLYPPLNTIQEISMRIAMGVTKCAYDTGLASTYPEPQDKRKWLEDQIYNFNYESSLPVTWVWPRMPYIKTRDLNPTKLFGEKQYDDECLMPNQQRGRCMPVKSCKSTYELFNNIQKTGGSITNSDQEKLLALHCGSMKNVPLICCPESEIQLNANSLDILQNTTCGVYNVNKVSNGNDAALFGFPWMALLKYNVQREPFKCEGTLISDQYILTAAHCVYKMEHLLSQVRLGEYKISTEEDCIILPRKKICAPPVEDIDIEEIIIHENYKGTFYHDIALLRLNRKIQTQRHIKPICLPIHGELREKEYENYVISGWGKTQNGTQADILQVALVPKVKRQECESQLKKHRLRLPLTIGQICAGGENFVDTCRGDSGGPLGYKDFYNDKPRFIQFGIVSYGVYDCGEANAPGIYTNVQQYMQWITDHMR